MKSRLSVSQVISSITKNTRLECQNSGFIEVIRKNWDDYTVEHVNAKTMFHYKIDDLILHLYKNDRHTIYTLITETKEEIEITK